MQVTAVHRLLLHPGVWLAARCNYLPPSHCTDRIARPAPTICVLQARARWARRPRLQLLLPLPSPATTASLWRPWISLLAAVACPRACTRLVSCVLGCRWVGVGGGGWGVGGSAMEVGGKGPGPQRMAACNRACNPAAQPHPPRLISVFCSLCPHICRLTPHLPTGAAVAKWGIEYEKPAAAAFKVNNPEVS